MAVRTPLGHECGTCRHTLRFVTSDGGTHESKVFFNKSGDSWEAIARCTCGWEKSALGESSSEAGGRVEAARLGHMVETRGNGTRAAGLLLSLLVAAVPVGVVVGMS